MKFLKTLLTFLFALTVPVAVGAFDPVGPVTVADLNLLRSRTPRQYPTVMVQAATATSGKGGGTFAATGQATCTDDGGVLIQGHSGCYKRVSSGPYNLTWFGAKCDGVQVADGVSKSSNATVTSASALWSSGMVGRVAVVNKAAFSGKQLVTTVQSFNNAGSLVLAASAGTSGTAETISIYTDDFTAIAAAFAAAQAAGVAVTLPKGGVCGIANPGSHRTLGFAGSLYLNEGTLWLGQTGPVSDTSNTIEFTGDQNWLVGPGVVDGLYQTNQGVSQLNSDALEWQHGADTTSGSGISGGITIQNTKGRCWLTTRAYNFTIDNLKIQNCGDFQYVPPSGDVETGRSMGGQADSSSGYLRVDGYTALTIAQSGILISNSTDSAFAAKLQNLYFSGNAYYGLDVEEIVGAITVNNISIVGNGGTHSRSFVYGGAQFLDVTNILYQNFKHTNLDSNSLVAQTAPRTAKMATWTFNNGTLQGTSASHAGSAYFSWQNVGTPQRLILSQVTLDSLEFQPQSAPACDATNPYKMLVSLHDVNLSQLYGNGRTLFDTLWAPDGQTKESIYVQGGRNNFGYMNVASGSTNQKELFFDIPNDLTKGPVTFVGGATTSIVTGSATIGQPRTSFTCP